MCDFCSEMHFLLRAQKHVIFAQKCIFCSEMSYFKAINELLELCRLVKTSFSRYNELVSSILLRNMWFFRNVLKKDLRNVLVMCNLSSFQHILITFCSELIFMCLACSGILGGLCIDHLHNSVQICTVWSIFALQICSRPDLLQILTDATYLLQIVEGDLSNPASRDRKMDLGHELEEFVLTFPRIQFVVQ